MAEEGTSICSPCEPGSFRGANMAACALCGLGRFASDTGAGIALVAGCNAVVIGYAEGALVACKQLAYAPALVLV